MRWWKCPGLTSFAIKHGFLFASISLYLLASRNPARRQAAASLKAFAGKGLPRPPCWSFAFAKKAASPTDTGTRKSVSQPHPLISSAFSTRAAESQHPHICSPTRHGFDNHQSLINLRMESEFLTMLKSRNRLVLTPLEQDIRCRFTGTSTTLTHFSAAVIG